MPKKRFNAEQIVVLLRDGSKLRRIASSIYPDLICDKDSCPTISVRPRLHLQHLQRPAPPHLSEDAPGIPSLGHADVARRDRD
jgi:hypothetical protein